MTTEKLLIYAYSQGIEVDNIRMRQARSLSVPLGNGRYAVAVDSSKIETNAELAVVLGHELGHCKTGSFYSPYSQPYEIKRCEKRADRWAIKKLVPKDEFIRAVKNGYTEAWEIADYFNVTTEFAYMAMWYYSYNNMAIDTYCA